jgi:hypothetical protein
MNKIEQEAKAFEQARIEEEEQARQRVALRLLCGIELSEIDRASRGQRAELIRRLGRLIERERLEGIRRHWSYDLNRHIALKQALDQLRGRRAPSPGSRKNPPCDGGARKNGARRRRSRKSVRD